MNSIVQNPDSRCCFRCGKTRNLEKHHIFGGGCRRLSDRYGLVVWLCHECHNEPPNGVHQNRKNMNRLKKIGQAAAMDKFGWNTEEFIHRFGKNYIFNEKEKKL